MTEIETMLENGIVPDFEKYYETGILVPVGKGLPISNPITQKTPGFENVSPQQIAEILETEGF